MDLRRVDVSENELIELEGDLDQVLREPDAVTWISPFRLVTADEGDLDGGSRGFTIFDREGEVRFTAGNALEHLVTRVGHYPEDRSENKGNEPEGVAYGQYGKHRFLFVGSERSNLISVYRIAFGRPKLVQVLPAGPGPEGLLAIPSRGLFAVASEVDDAEVNVFPLVQKTLVRDLMPDLEGPNGLVIEKVEGLAVNKKGRAFIVTDNDGVGDSSGETQFLRLGKID